MTMQSRSHSAARRRRAFTLAEVMVAVGVIGVLFVSLYLAFSASFSIIRTARENLRATQILVQRAETLRLYTWQELLDPTYFKTSFVDAYAPLGTTYYGTISVSKPTNLGTPSYLDDTRTVTISVQWTNSIGTPQPHFRTLQTQVARYGLQNYVYGGHTQ